MKKYITAIPHPLVSVGKNSEYRERIYDAISDEMHTECFEAAGRDAEIGTGIG